MEEQEFGTGLGCRELALLEAAVIMQPVQERGTGW